MLDDYTMKAFQKVLCGLVLGSLALGAGAVALSHKVSSNDSLVRAEGATNAGSFVVTDIGTANVFDNPNDMIFVWVEGVDAQLDYPDVDGTLGVNISADVIEGIGGIGSYSVDGEVRNLIGGQFYMNMWTRHQVFTFMPERACFEGLVIRIIYPNGLFYVSTKAVQERFDINVSGIAVTKEVEAILNKLIVTFYNQPILL